MHNPTRCEELTAQQLVRYEALFQLMEELRTLDNIESIAGLSARRWKYFANAGAWRLVVSRERGFVVIDGSRGAATVSEVEALSPWDEHHWQAQHPCTLEPQALDGLPPLPTGLTGPAVSQILVLPVQRAGRSTGLLTVAARHAPLTALDRKFISLFGGHLCDHIGHVLLRRETMDALRNLAAHDVLTGALNRRAIMDRLRTQLALSQRTGQPLSVLIADVDHFKWINDQLGHPAGDEALCELVRRFQGLTRASESFGRYGGEEFLFVLYPCGPEEAVLAAERIRRSVAATPFTLDAAAQVTRGVTISMGAASSAGLAQPDVESLIHSADEALYQSKAAGRNRVTLGTRHTASEVPEVPDAPVLQPL